MSIFCIRFPFPYENGLVAFQKLETGFPRTPNEVNRKSVSLEGQTSFHKVNRKLVSALKGQLNQVFGAELADLRSSASVHNTPFLLLQRMRVLKKRRFVLQLLLNS